MCGMLRGGDMARWGSWRGPRGGGNTWQRYEGVEASPAHMETAFQIEGTEWEKTSEGSKGGSPEVSRVSSWTGKRGGVPGQESLDSDA